MSARTTARKRLAITLAAIVAAIKLMVVIMLVATNDARAADPVPLQRPATTVMEPLKPSPARQPNVVASEHMLPPSDPQYDPVLVLHCVADVGPMVPLLKEVWQTGYNRRGRKATEDERMWAFNWAYRTKLMCSRAVLVGDYPGVVP